MDTHDAGASFEFPDAAGYPDGAGFLDEGTDALVDEVAAEAAHWFDEPSADAEREIEVHHDETRHAYFARIGRLEVGSVRYAEIDGRVVVTTTTVLPEFRGRGIAIELIADSLDDLRDRVGRVAVTCPVVSAFMETNTQFADMLEPQ